MNPTTIMLVDVKLFDSTIIMDDIRSMFKNLFSGIVLFDVKCIDSYRNVWCFEAAVNTKKINKLKLTKLKIYQFMVSKSHYAGKYQSLDYYIDVKL